MGHSVSVVIPARNEARTVGQIVSAIVALEGVRDAIVVDDGSTDATAAVALAAGATVIEATRGPGKGAAMADGVAAAAGDLIVFCDADLEDFDPSFITTLASTLAAAGDEVVLVKADYERVGEGGRVTELTARPALDLLHPELGHIAQPLGGEYAAWKDVLEEVPFVRGYGVEMGLLLDLAERYGPDSIRSVHLGRRRHRNRSLAELNPQAREVLAVVLARAGLAGVNVEVLPPLAAGRAPRPARRSA